MSRTRTIKFKIANASISNEIIAMAICATYSVINSLAVRSTGYAAIISIMEMLCLIALLIKNDIRAFTIFYITTLSLSIGNVQFATGDPDAVVYSILNPPVFKAYLTLLVLIIAIAKTFLSDVSGIRHAFRSGKNGKLGGFFILNAICVISGAIMPLFTLAMNDNNVFDHMELCKLIVRDEYQIIFMFSSLCLAVYCLIKCKDFDKEIDCLLKGILSGVTWGAVLLILLGNYHLYGNGCFIACPLVLFFSPGLILFYRERHGLFYFFTGLLSIAIQMKYTVGIAGTWWAYVGCIGLFFVRSLLPARGKRRVLLFKFFCTLSLCAIFALLLLKGSQVVLSGHIYYKLTTFAAFFERNASFYDWYNGLGGSIQCRIEEFVNVIIELSQKPCMLLFGKGYGGTVHKHWGMSDWNVFGSTFTDPQIIYRTYSAFHVALTEIIINNGLVGVLLIAMVLKELVSAFLRENGNAWIIIGGLWFIFFYTLYYSFNVGMFWLCFGYFSIERERHEHTVLQPVAQRPD